MALLLKIGTLLPELSAQEKIVDGFVEMLCKDLLDENISMDPVYKIIDYYQVVFMCVLYKFLIFGFGHMIVFSKCIYIYIFYIT